jgi:very-short-patch-repair endonuclease
MGQKRPHPRRGADPLMKQRARELRSHETEAEALLWRAIRSEQLCGHKFRRQQTIGP